MSTISNLEEWTTFLKTFAAANGENEQPRNPGASEQQLLKAETRLEVKLPPSYRAFLSASNGWRLPFDTGLMIRAVEDLRWFRKEHKDWLAAYQMSAEPLCVMERDYFDYEMQDCVVFEIKHLAQALCISETADDAVLLLNPMVVWPDGEWETWYFANSAPEAIRYRSFSDWIRKESDQVCEQTSNPGELPTVFLDAPTKIDRRVRPREKVPLLENVLEMLKSKKDRERVKAAKQLGLLGGKAAVDALLGLLKNDPIKEVRWAASGSLGRLAAPEAIETLIAAVEDPLVNTTAIHALTNFNDERSAQYLLKILENGGYCATTASGALRTRGDVRAIHHLVRFLADTATKSEEIQHIGDIAGRLIAGFGDAGYVALEPLMYHPDVKVRGRAELGISDLAYCSTEKKLRGKAYDLLQSLLETETDEGLLESIRTAIQISTKKNLQ